MKRYYIHTRTGAYNDYELAVCEFARTGWLLERGGFKRITRKRWERAYSMLLYYRKPYFSICPLIYMEPDPCNPPRNMREIIEQAAETSEADALTEPDPEDMPEF